jgi:RHS repeat-associated protein
VTYPAFNYWYNLAGELTKEQYPSGRTVLTSYDSAGRVSGITGLLGSTSTTYLSNISYWPHGAVYQQKYGNNLWRSYTFNSRLQVNQQWDAIYNAPSYFLSFEIYNWGTSNNNGNLQSRNEYFGGPTTFGSLQEITQNYSYDTLSRVQYFSEASSGSQGVCGGTCSYRYYGYDRWGNQWITANGGLPNPALATTTNNYNPATNYRYDEAYDGAGNQTSVDGDNATYDAENRLRLLVNPMTGAMETFLYDGAGRRVQKSYSSHTTNYVYDALGFLAAEYSASAVSKEYIPFGSQVIAVENASGSPCQTCYLNYDHLGSVRLVTDQSANVVARHDYVPYGEEIFPPYAGRTAPFGNTDYVNPRFTGQMRDTENLLDFFNARYFGPGLGRFVSPDPMNAGADVGNPQSWNGYLYGLGNPLVYTDPSGMIAGSSGGGSGNPATASGGDNPLVFSGQNIQACWAYLSQSYGSYSAASSGLNCIQQFAMAYWSGPQTGGGGGTQTTQSTPQPPAKNACPSSVMQTIYASALDAAFPTEMYLAAKLARKTGKTIMFGLSGSASGGLPGLPRVSRSVSVQGVLAVDSKGSVGLLFSAAAGIGAGDGLAAGLDLGASLSPTIAGLAGPSYSVGFGGGDGYGGAVQLSNNGGGTATATVGFGLGGFGIGGSYGPTAVVPLVCHQ